MKIDKSTSFEEKEELLIKNRESYSIFSCNKKLILILFIFMIFAISLVAVRLNIYHYSKIYAELVDKKNVLVEENKELKRKIEALQFKNKITNYFEVQYENK